MSTNREELRKIVPLLLVGVTFVGLGLAHRQYRRSYAETERSSSPLVRAAESLRDTLAKPAPPRRKGLFPDSELPGNAAKDYRFADEAFGWSFNPTGTPAGGAQLQNVLELETVFSASSLSSGWVKAANTVLARVRKGARRGDCVWPKADPSTARTVAVTYGANGQHPGAILVAFARREVNRKLKTQREVLELWTDLLAYGLDLTRHHQHAAVAAGHDVIQAACQQLVRALERPDAKLANAAWLSGTLKDASVSDERPYLERGIFLGRIATLEMVGVRIQKGKLVLPSGGPAFGMRSWITESLEKFEALEQECEKMLALELVGRAQAERAYLLAISAAQQTFGFGADVEMKLETEKLGRSRAYLAATRVLAQAHEAKLKGAAFDASLAQSITLPPDPYDSSKTMRLGSSGGGLSCYSRGPNGRDDKGPRGTGPSNNDDEGLLSR